MSIPGVPRLSQAPRQALDICKEKTRPLVLQDLTAQCGEAQTDHYGDGSPEHCGSPSWPGRPCRELSLEDEERGESKLRPKRVASLGWLMVAEKGHLVRTLTSAKKECAAGCSKSGR